MMLNRFDTTAEVNTEFANRRTSSIGFGVASWRRTKLAPATIATDRLSQKRKSAPDAMLCLMAKTSGARASIDRMMENGSKRPGFGSRDSGSRIAAAGMKSAMSGRLMKKTELQWKCSSRKPPTMGPSAAPPENIAAQVAIAMRRSLSWLKMLRMSDSVDGMRVAPKMPSRARARMSISAEVENAASSEAAPKPTDPMMSSLRRPTRSPRLPMATSRPASMSA